MIYSVFQERPGLSYLLLGLVFVVGVTQVVLAGADFLPDRYDWVLGSLLFGTTLAWMGAAALAGVVAPVSNTVMKYACGVLTAFSLILISSVIAVIILDSQIDNLHSYWLITTTVGLTFGLWMTLAGLVGSLAPRDINAKAYIPLVIAPILVGISVLALLISSTLSHVLMPRLGQVGYTQPTLFGLYGLATFLLFREFLARLKWTRRLRSGALFVLVVVATIALAIPVLWAIGWVHWVRDLWRSALFVVVILAPFGIVALRTRDFGVATAALGIAMASYWVIIIVSFMATAALMGDSPYRGFGVLWLSFISAGIVVSIPAGYLISEMRHPYRSVLVASIGPGLLTMMMMSFYWFEVLGKGF